MELKFCPICGFKLYPESNFCSNCGEPLSKYKEQNEATQPIELSTSIEVEEAVVEQFEIENESFTEKEIHPLSIDETDDLIQDADVSQPINKDEHSASVIDRNGESTIDAVEAFEESEDVAQPKVAETEQEVFSEIVIDETQSEPISIEQNQDEFEDKNECGETDQDISEQKKVRILGIPEWAFYSALIIIGISVVVFVKLTSTNENIKNEGATLIIEQNDTIKKDVVDSIKVETQIKDNDANKIEKDSAMPPPSAKIEMPKQSGTDLDSAYHVIITTVSDSEKASEIAKSSSYKGAYVVNNGSKYSVAVFRSIKKADAKLYMDSIVKKDIPDAWLYHGVVK